MAKLELNIWNVNNELEGQNDEDLLQSMIDDYNSDNYIGDAISEVADGSVSVYNSDILEKTKDLYFSGAYEEASLQGLMEESHDLISNLQMAWYQYNTQVLYENLEDVIFNYGVNYINNNFELDGEVIEELEDVLEEELKSIDNNSKFVDIENLIGNLIEGIREEQQIK